MRRLDNIDLRLLRVFITLADAGSFPAAQIALNLSQSTLSSHLAALERKLGGPLCVRGRRGFRLTPLGTATRQAAQQLFADIDSFQQRVGAMNGELIGRLRIGMVDGVAHNPALALQETLRAFMERAADVRIDLELGTPHDLERAIADGARDIVVGPLSQKAPGVVYVPLHREMQGLYCGRGHELFAAPDAAVTQEAIERSLFSVRGYRHLDDLYRVGHPRPAGTVVHMEAQAMMILSGRFIGFLPCPIGEDWVARDQMREMRPHTYRYPSQHFAAFRREAAGNPLVGSFLEELKRQAAPA